MQMYISIKYGLLYSVSKFGFLSLFELTTCSLLYRNRISNESVFAGTRNSKNDGYLIISKDGTILSLSVDETQLAGYMLTNCRHIPDVVQLVFKLAARYRLPGVENMFL